MALLAPVVGVAQKNRKKEPSENDVRTTLIRQAEVAVTSGDLDSAEVLFAKALWMWPDAKTNRQQAQLLLMKADTAGHCKQMAIYPREGEQDKAFYGRYCIRHDSVAFEQSGLALAEFPNITNVARTWYRAGDETTYELYDGSDSLRYSLRISKDDTVYGHTDRMARFLTGEKEMFNFLMKNTKYPSAAMDAGIAGVVYLTFVVERDGRLTNLEVIRGPHHSLNTEALRVVGAMPPWQPAQKQDKIVRSSFNLPVRFTLR